MGLNRRLSLGWVVSLIVVVGVVSGTVQAKEPTRKARARADQILHTSKVTSGDPCAKVAFGPQGSEASQASVPPAYLRFEYHRDQPESADQVDSKYLQGVQNEKMWMRPGFLQTSDRAPSFSNRLLPEVFFGVDGGGLEGRIISVLVDRPVRESKLFGLRSGPSRTQNERVILTGVVVEFAPKLGFFGKKKDQWVIDLVTYDGKQGEQIELSDVIDLRVRRNIIDFSAQRNSTNPVHPASLFGAPQIFTSVNAEETEWNEHYLPAQIRRRIAEGMPTLRVDHQVSGAGAAQDIRFRPNHRWMDLIPGEYEFRERSVQSGEARIFDLFVNGTLVHQDVSGLPVVALERVVVAGNDQAFVYKLVPGQLSRAVVAAIETSSLGLERSSLFDKDNVLRLSQPSPGEERVVNRFLLIGNYDAGTGADFPVRMDRIVGLGIALPLGPSPQ